MYTYSLSIGVTEPRISQRREHGGAMLKRGFSEKMSGVSGSLFSSFTIGVNNTNDVYSSALSSISFFVFLSYLILLPLCSQIFKPPSPTFFKAFFVFFSFTIFTLVL